MGFIAELIVSFFLIVSGIFALVGSFGMIKLPELMTRLHAPTKATTLGVGGVLLASLAQSWLVDGIATFHELLITIFLFLTAPVTAHFIAKAHIHGHISPEELPKPGEDECWACHAAPEDTNSASKQAG